VSEPRVLLQASLAGAADSTKRFYGKLVLTDHGEHIEFTDGKRTWRWRLADQAPSEYPVLAGIVLARFGSAVGVGGGSDRIIFVDPDGAILAHYSPQRLVPVELQDLIMPPEIYQPLAERGVGVRREKYVTEKAFYAAHPDTSVTGFSLSFASHPFLWLGGAFIVIVIVVNLILLATGYYS
ncbi:MAG: hypothetical protein ABI140_03995, partial [Jatrophihabitantaceae bacterium]